MKSKILSKNASLYQEEYLVTHGLRVTEYPETSDRYATIVINDIEHLKRDLIIENGEIRGANWKVTL